MRACSRDDCSNADLGTLAARDSALTAETLRIVNSAWFGFREEVRTVAHAAVILGQRALRNLVLCIAVRDALKGTQIANFDTEQFAEDCLRRAVAAGVLAKFSGVDREEAFTAGLLQDIGLMVLFIVQPQTEARFADLRNLDPQRRLEMECENFGMGHDAAGALIAKQWELPENLREAIAEHHLDDATQSSGLSKTLLCADWLAAVYEVEQHGACLGNCRSRLGELLGIPAGQVDECLAELPQELAVAARDLGLETAEQPTFEQLMRDANATLAEENLSYQELTLRLQNTLRERDRLAAELDRELEEAREIQRALFPGTMPEDFPLVGVNISAKRLSGDFYDYFQLPDGRIFFCLGDVSGKGANAAILMAKVAGLFRCLARQCADLAALVEIVNRETAETSVHGMFVTLACGVFDPCSKQLVFVNAGHLPALLLSSGEKPCVLRAHAPPLGVLEDSVYKEVNCDLAGRDLYLFSDGVTESHTADGSELGIGGLLKLLMASREQTPREQLDFVVSQLLRDGQEARDDLTLVRLTAVG
jgi:sigma-B regulation protein RsbU (phosphoserine phosphatase)